MLGTSHLYTVAVCGPV